MFDYRKARRKRRTDIAEIERKYKATSASNEDEADEIAAAYMDKLTCIEHDFLYYETRWLERQLSAFGIDEGPPLEMQEVDYRGRTVFTDEGKSKAKRLIIDARFAYWKRWVDVISPIVSVILSIIALLIAALALYLQFTETVPTIPK